MNYDYAFVIVSVNCQFKSVFFYEKKYILQYTFFRRKIAGLTFFSLVCVSPSMVSKLYNRPLS